MNRATGELVWVLTPAERAPRGHGWYTQVLAALTAVSQMPLPARTLRVLLAVLGKLDFDNWIYMSQAALAKELHMSRPAVSAAVKQLETLGIIARLPRESGLLAYRLHPLFAWRGSVKSHRTALVEAEKRGWRVLGTPNA